MEITDYHAKFFAHELTRRCASDEVDKLAPVLADSQVDLNPHQVEAALFAFQNPLSKGAILADEVGLGKTIEAALLLAQKWAEGKRKLLVILPANLRKQWSQELADKFHNFKPWDGDRAKDAGALRQQLLENLEHILPGGSEQDLLYEILLKDGFELTTPIETFEVRGFRVHSVAGGELLLCLQDKLTHELIVALAERRPSRVVFLDRGFRDNDQLKANAAKLFASKAGDAFKKFKTV